MNADISETIEARKITVSMQTLLLLALQVTTPILKPTNAHNAV